MAVRKRATRDAISAEEARTIVLCAQGLAGEPDATPGDVLRRCGAVQLDTISVLARSHELVQYARLGPTPRDAIEDAYWGSPARAFEYYAHANCVLPIEAWPYFAFRRRHFAAAMRRGVLDAKMIDAVRARLREGPATSSDFAEKRPAGGWWSWSDAKRALEFLYIRGEAVVTTRRRWQRVYDLAERVVPKALLRREPDDAECFRYLIGVAGRALGVATRRDLAAHHQLMVLRAGRPSNAEELIDDAIAANGLVQVEVEGWDVPAYADPALLASLGAPVQHRTTLLSPFDSLMWERAPTPERTRSERLFGYRYKIEAYTPKEQRLHGYFTMPLLAGGRIAGHVDPAREVTRADKTLVARNVALHDPSMVPAMASALREAARWVGCDAVRIERASRPRTLVALRRALR